MRTTKWHRPDNDIWYESCVGPLAMTTLIFLFSIQMHVLNWIFSHCRMAHRSRRPRQRSQCNGNRFRFNLLGIYWIRDMCRCSFDRSIRPIHLIEHYVSHKLWIRYEWGTHLRLNKKQYRFQHSWTAFAQLNAAPAYTSTSVNGHPFSYR